jgi:hypothetical protein
MTTNQQHDNDIEASLKRAAGYLARQGAEYLEQPVYTSTAGHDAPRRYRRVLVGTAAAATLTVAVLAGSFIGGTSSGKVEVAQAAWTAEPGVVTSAKRDEIKKSCNPIIEEFWKSDNVQNKGSENLPADLSDPAIVDIRGTTQMSLYFSGDLSVLCFKFLGGAVMAQRIDGFNHLTDGIGKGSLTPLPIAINDGPIGIIFGTLPDASDEGTRVVINQVGQKEDITATLLMSAGSYFAWSPNLEAVSVKFIDSRANVFSTLGPKSFPEPCLGSCYGTPTTVPSTQN